jgi:hypothetical protein
MALAAMAAGGPLAYERVSQFHSGVKAAAPPAAVVDIATAYPLAEAPMMKDTAGDAGRPANALAWSARGVALTSQVLVLAQEYLLEQDQAAGDDPTSAVVEQLWAQDVPEKTSGIRKTAQAASASTFFVLQGWTVAASGASRAVLLAGEYAPQSSSIAMYEAPLSFLHPAAGEAPGPDDVADVSELSIYSADTNQLVVLGAPQVTKVLYAADGKKLVEEPTTDGIAVFPRVKPKSRQGYVDTVQVRDAQNQALTPPGAWTAADFVLGGDVAVYKGDEWQLVQAGGGTSSAPSATVWSSRPTASPTGAGTPDASPDTSGPASTSTGPGGVRVGVGSGAGIGVSLGPDGADGSDGAIGVVGSVGPVGPIAVTVTQVTPSASAPTG